MMVGTFARTPERRFVASIWLDSCLPHCPPVGSSFLPLAPSGANCWLLRADAPSLQKSAFQFQQKDNLLRCVGHRPPMPSITLHRRIWPWAALSGMHCISDVVPFTAVPHRTLACLMHAALLFWLMQCCSPVAHSCCLMTPAAPSSCPLRAQPSIMQRALPWQNRTAAQHAPHTRTGEPVALHVQSSRRDMAADA